MFKRQCLKLMDDIEACLEKDLKVSCMSEVSLSQQKRDHVKTKHRVCMEKFRNDAMKYCGVNPEYLV
jgi:hypothetical protein